jgi:hypothetical protein
VSGSIIFLASIVAILESLVVYQVHGQNLFADRPEGSKPRYEIHIKTQRELVEGMKNWLIKRG